MIASCASLIAGREKQTICIFFSCAGQTHLKSIISPINFFVDDCHRGINENHVTYACESECLLALNVGFKRL